MNQNRRSDDLTAHALPTARASNARAEPDLRPPDDISAHQLSVALTWGSRGTPVVPCSRTDKGPMVAGFGKDASAEQLAPFSDPAQVRAWWTGRFRRAHVGILTRALVVVDLDMLKPDTAPPSGHWDGCQGGSDVLELLMREAGADWPDTYTVLTPSGGMHLYFVQPDGEPIGCATGDRPGAPHLGPLIDVRGVGGLVIAAGSYSAAQGRPYTRISPPGLRPQPLPAWLLELLRPAAPAAAPRPPAPVVRQLPTGDRAERYATAALIGEVDKLADRARGGEYWSTVSAAALRLAELHHTAPHILTEQAVTNALVDTATRAGMEERAAKRAVRTAWERKAFGGAA